MANGKVEYIMVLVSEYGHLIIHMKDITTWTHAMLLESIHVKMVKVMRVNIFILNYMDMESL